MNEVLRRKMKQGRLGARDLAERPGGARASLPVALSRAFREGANLVVEVRAVEQYLAGLPEVLEALPEPALLLLLDGPEGALGLAALSPDVSGALIEMQTIGAVLPALSALRRPTRVDAAMVVGVMDAALEEFDRLIMADPDVHWAAGYRYASFLDEPRPLGLILEDHLYRLLSLELGLTEGGRCGTVLLALPAEGGSAALSPEEAARRAEEAAAFTEAFAQAVMECECRLEAILARVRLPLGAFMALEEGQVLPMPRATLGNVELRDATGRVVARAHLGQNKGMRALRLSDPRGAEEGREMPEEEDLAVPCVSAPMAMPATEEQTEVGAAIEPMPPPMAMAFDAEGALPEEAVRDQP